MIIVVGLGNPGRKYESTRHNAGFLVVDALAERATQIRRETLECAAALRCELAGAEVALVWPTTYMNRSGDAIREALSVYDVPPEDLFVVTDEVYLPLGAVRLRTQGSDGGHNGMASVLAAAGHNRVPRLRVGVGRGDTPIDLVEYVLGEFTAEETPLMQQVVVRAADCVELYLRSGAEAAMNSYNGVDLLAVSAETTSDPDAAGGADAT